MSQVLQVNGDYKLKVLDGGTIVLDAGTAPGTIEVIGNLDITGNVTLTGSITIGAGTETAEFSSSLIPSIDNRYNLGSPAKTWKNLYVNEISNPDNPTIRIKNLLDPVDRQDAATKRYTDSLLGFQGAEVSNVLYVSMDGDDTFTGTRLAQAKRTIKAALEVATYGTTIFIKSGDYTEDNPLTVPEGVGIWGDSLRTVTIRPANKTQDLFWVNNGVYIAQVTFKDHESPSAAVAFNPDGSAGVIHTSPYVQNCTSMTTTGTGMRVDGAHCDGLRSMVVDAFTQYNQGGIGIHMLNRGNTQLVSVFTICCEKAILCENGGFCSLTNSNSSFGDFGLVADGASAPINSGRLVGNSTGDVFVINNLTQIPSIGDALSFETGDNTITYYTVSETTPLSIGGLDIEMPDVTGQPTAAKNARQIVLNNKKKIQVDTIDFLNDTFVDFDFDQFKATRDAGLIIDAVVDDMVLGTNYKTVQAGIAFYRATGIKSITIQKTETLAAINFVKTQTLALLPDSPEKTIISNNFDTVIDIFDNGVSQAPAYVFGDPDDVDPNKTRAKDIIQANRQFLIEEGISYIDNNFLIYDRNKCRRDLGLIIDAVFNDLVFGSNYQTVTAGLSYYRNIAGSQYVLNNQKSVTVAAINKTKELVLDILTDSGTKTQVELLFEIVTNIITLGVASAPTIVFPVPSEVSSSISNAANLIESNKNFLKTIVTGWITAQVSSETAPFTSDFTYDVATCQRDVELIVDALRYDLLYGGNTASKTAGDAYYQGTVISGEVDQTIAAYEFLKTIISSVAQNIAVTETYGASPQVFGPAGSILAAATIVERLDDIISVGGVIETINPNYSLGDPVYLAQILLVQEAKEDIQDQTIQWLENEYPIKPLLSYNENICRRDIGFIVDAVTYDILYGGNSQTTDAADEYYSTGTLQIALGEKQATVDTFNYVKSVCASCVTNTPVEALNELIIQNVSLPAASEAEANQATALFDVVTEVVANAYTSTITIEEIVNTTILNGTNVNFHQYSLITASGQTFEWVGAGTNVNTALPYQGGRAIVENYVVETNGGKIYYTGTDQRGDFRIGNDFVINRNNGTIEGRTFTKSLFAVMTPYILAIGE